MPNLQNYKEPQSHLVPKELIDVINRELMAMLARNMDFSPAPEDIGIVAQVLASDLFEVGISDPVIVGNALKKAGRTFEKWPSTAAIISLIKPTGSTHAKMYQLEHQQRKNYTEEEIGNIKELIREAKIKAGWTEEKPLTNEQEKKLLADAVESYKELNQ